MAMGCHVGPRLKRIAHPLHNIFVGGVQVEILAPTGARGSFAAEAFERRGVDTFHASHYTRAPDPAH